MAELELVQTLPQLVLIRGLPGSGKSTMAKVLAQIGYEHFEADMFFVDENGNYAFDPNKIKWAHRWCQESTQAALKEGKNVVVTNTFTTKWEIETYLKMPARGIRILTATGNFGSIHDVPAEAIARMKERWEELPGY